MKPESNAKPYIGGQLVGAAFFFALAGFSGYWLWVGLEGDTSIPALFFFLFPLFFIWCGYILLHTIANDLRSFRERHSHPTRID